MKEKINTEVPTGVEDEKEIYVIINTQLLRKCVDTACATGKSKRQVALDVAKNYLGIHAKGEQAAYQRLCDMYKGIVKAGSETVLHAYEQYFGLAKNELILDTVSKKTLQLITRLEGIKQRRVHAQIMEKIEHAKECGGATTISQGLLEEIASLLSKQGSDS